MALRAVLKLKGAAGDYLSITLSAVLTAIAVNVFFQSTGLAPGGITGLSIICSLITGIPVAYMTLCISIPLLVFATIVLGKSFGIKTLYITLATPVCMKLIPSADIVAAFPGLPRILVIAGSALSGGLLVGGAIGVALNHSCATGGTDVIALLVQHFLKFLKVPVILLALDGSVVIASGLISKDAGVALFSFLSLLTIINTIKFVTTRKFKKQLRKKTQI